MAKLLAVAVTLIVIGIGVLLSQTNTTIINNAEASQRIIATITAYSASEDETDSRPWEMASGKTVYEGAVACPRNIPLGTKVEINGSEFVCEDRMNIRYTDRFDIFKDSKAEALQFGIFRNQEVIILN